MLFFSLAAYLTILYDHLIFIAASPFSEGGPMSSLPFASEQFQHSLQSSSSQEMDEKKWI